MTIYERFSEALEVLLTASESSSGDMKTIWQGKYFELLEKIGNLSVSDAGRIFDNAEITEAGV